MSTHFYTATAAFHTPPHSTVIFTDIKKEPATRGKGMEDKKHHMMTIS